MSASFYDKNSSLYNKPSKDTYKTQNPKTTKQTKQLANNETDKKQD
ncbi:hypothetical protein ID0109_24610 [Helicobacter pylori]